MRVPYLLIGALLCLPSLYAVAASYSGAPVYGSDALGRSLPESSAVQSFRKDRYVGIFYFLWLNLDAVYDVSKILAENPGAHDNNASPPWGPVNAYHFWGEPLYGYYRSLGVAPPCHAVV